METVTPQQLIDTVAPYCVYKMQENAHKQGPFSLGLVYLHGRERDEAEEKRQAMLEYMDNPTPETASAYLKEIGDTINFLLFQAGVVLGIKELKR